MRTVLVGLLTMLLVACTTQADSDRQRLMKALADGEAATDRCIQQMMATPAFNAIGWRFDRTKGPASQAEMVDGAYATAAEVAQIYSLQGSAQDCRRVRLEATTNVSSALTPIVAERYARQDENLARLVKRQATWGEFHRAEAQANLQYSTRMESALNALLGRS